MQINENDISGGVTYSAKCKPFNFVNYVSVTFTGADNQLSLRDPRENLCQHAIGLNFVITFESNPCYFLFDPSVVILSTYP